MAYNDSGELPASQSTYSLGGYTFELKVQEVREPGEDPVVSIFAICHSPDGSRETQAIDFPIGRKVESWSVEANETEATVYVAIEGKENPIPYEILHVNDYVSQVDWFGRTVDLFIGEVGDATPETKFYCTSYNDRIYVATDQVGGSAFNRTDGVQFNFAARVDYYYHSFDQKPLFSTVSPVDPEGFDCRNHGYEGGEHLVGRFAIDIREADPEDWDDPGDYGPPGTTLYVTVTGATAGSCTGTPADNETVKGYGDGGDGGYGGGGGAGASTVIIYEFPTSIADSVVQEAISRGPGTGGPGGKGGKGGDGCILIFY